MNETESQQFDERFVRALGRARAYLERRDPPPKVWPVLAAAAFFAASSMIFAVAAVTAPSPQLSHPVAVRGLQ